MPCRSYDDEPSYSSSGSRETQNKMDMLARMACRALTALETINASGNDPVINEVLADSEIKVWWPKHKAADAAEQERKRKVAEAAADLVKAKKAALAKLTKEEKKILGIK